MKLSRPFRMLAAASTLVVSLFAAAPVAPSAAAVAYRAAGHMSPAVGVHPQFKVATKDAGHQAIFTCQLPSFGFPCYGPQQIRAAYDVQPLLDRGITGKHQTIVIVDAFQSPTIRQDLSLFDSTFGLNDPTFNQFAPDGLTPFNPKNANQVGWSGEISLDVEWAHAIAPGATIDLVLSKSDNDADILSALKYAVNHNLGDVISQSFGEGEICLDPALRKPYHDLYRAAARKNMTVFASSGDNGAAQPTCDGTSLFLSASTPATDPLVTAVGGTNLTANLDTGAYRSEMAWNDGFGQSGGGFSVMFSRPDYQKEVAGIHKARGVPDVAYNGGVFGGVIVAWGVPFGPGAFFIFGGTSAGSPQWAGITALADQKAGHRLGTLNNQIYEIGQSEDYARSFHDITVGDNIVPGLGGFTTSRGWDAVTGWGTPRAASLVADLVGGERGGDHSGG